jgi:acetyl esterase/lipase
MMRKILLGTLLLAMTTGCGARMAAADGSERGGGMFGLRSMMGAFSDDDGGGDVKLPAGVRVERDISYGPDPKQRYDVYRRAGSERAAPVIVMVHGGAWMYGDKASGGIVNNKVARWVPKGYVFVSVNYPLSPQANPVEQARNVAKAMAQIQSTASSWGGDPDRVLLMGHSSGAHLVALIAASPAIAEEAGVKPWLGTVALDSAAMDVPSIMNRRHYRFYDKVFGDDPSLWRRASPIDQLSGKPRPIMLVCSSERDDSCPQANKFAAKIDALGGKVRVYPVALKHKQINENLGTDEAYTGAVETFMRTLGLP